MASELQWKVVKFRQNTAISKTNLPKNMEAGKVFPIRDVKMSTQIKYVSVQGTIKEIYDVKTVQMKTDKGMKKDKQDFQLEDGTGSIKISLWGDDTRHLNGISVGDVVQVNNLKTNIFKGIVSLNSTDQTTITKQEKVVKVGQNSAISKANIGNNMEAEKVFPIRDVKMSTQKKDVSVQGTIKEIYDVKTVQMKKDKGMMKDKQDFKLEDGTGSIKISLWGDDTRHLNGISVRDVVQVNNLKTNVFKGIVSLNSTDKTTMTKMDIKTLQDSGAEMNKMKEHGQDQQHDFSVGSTPRAG
ncbi:uncharacterized protein LOC119781206 [Cyprinodon tularosa]|uniref:uncharacterized protein LOC119781206 n=1 Tax=Cyprinodon tularosa TaxID=77115 RepID=UPI0018E2915A|nr:uncharacterized protein LOC119781206 [Cyprinodon tularosa]